MIRGAHVDFDIDSELSPSVELDGKRVSVSHDHGVFEGWMEVEFDGLDVPRKVLSVGRFDECDPLVIAAV